MINPALLTKENGFEDGVVVEVNGRPYIFMTFHPGNTRWNAHVECKEGQLFLLPNIESIRPLTGKMAHWGLDWVPKWASWCEVRGNGIVYWLDSKPMNSLGTVTKRPFWAKETPHA